jgi:hypothetical protein
VSFGFWSDEDRWFLPRALGFGYSLNLKYVAKRLGWIRTDAPAESAEQTRTKERSGTPDSRQDRLRRQADESKYEARP